MSQAISLQHALRRPAILAIIRHTGRDDLVVSDEVIGWISLQVSWMTVYLDSSVQDLWTRLLYNYLDLTRPGADVDEELQQLILEAIRSSPNERLVSAVALYPVMSEHLQLMIQDKFGTQLVE